MAGSFIAISALGLSAAMVSGLTLEQEASTRLSQVATAENLIEEMRLNAGRDFSQLPAKYDGASVADTSEGLTQDTKQMLAVRVPLDEGVVPGSIDLDDDGKTKNNVKAEDANILVVDIEAGNGIRLRTAMLDLAKLGMDRATVENDVVSYGETLDPTATQTATATPPPAPTTDMVEDAVTVGSAAFVGKSAELVLVNSSSGEIKPTAISVSPSDPGYFFEGVKLNGSVIYTKTAEQSAGTVFLPLNTSATLAPGESTMVFGDFFVIDGLLVVRKRPTEVTITVYFEDGSITTARVRN